MTAQHYLGCRYAIGQGVEKDDQKAMFWHRKASDQGHPEAQNKLKDFYRNQYADKSNEELISFYHE
ncbi:MAG: SEL1-like repeat protein, partial [Methylococcaceae bacterium]|nr:SEL1-like repeat protein [Methylococcaceae bacterium]